MESSVCRDGTPQNHGALNSGSLGIFGINGHQFLYQETDGDVLVGFGDCDADRQSPGEISMNGAGNRVESRVFTVNLVDKINISRKESMLPLGDR